MDTGDTTYGAVLMAASIVGPGVLAVVSISVYRARRLRRRLRGERC